MSVEYIKRADVTVDGVVLIDFDGVSIDETTVSERVPTMNGRGHALDIADPGLTISEMRRSGTSLIDLSNLVNSIITVAPIGSNKRFTFNGCHTMTVGAEAFGRDDVAKRDIDIGADTVTIEG